MVTPMCEYRRGHWFFMKLKSIAYSNEGKIQIISNGSTGSGNLVYQD
jgi:hypothetical protein